MKGAALAGGNRRGACYLSGVMHSCMSLLRCRPRLVIRPPSVETPVSALHPRVPQSATRCLSQLKRLARALYSNPPTHGARIAAEVVNDKELFEVRA